MNRNNLWERRLAAITGRTWRYRVNRGEAPLPQLKHWAAAVLLAGLAHLAAACLYYEPVAAPRPPLNAGMQVALLAASGREAAESAVIAASAPAPESRAVEAIETAAPAETVHPVSAKAIGPAPAAPPEKAPAVKRKAAKPEAKPPLSRPSPPRLPQPAAASKREGQQESPIKTKASAAAPGAAAGVASAPPSGDKGGHSPAGGTRGRPVIAGNHQTVAQAAAAPMPGNPRPDYPPLARRRGYEGRVVIRASVAPDGGVASAAVGQSSGYGILDRAALQAVKRWRFRPAQRGGQPVATVLDVPVVFRLEQG